MARPINPALGPDNPQSKLSPEQVKACKINRHGEPARVWADRFGVSLTTVYKIWHRQTWVWVS